MWYSMAKFNETSACGHVGGEGGGIDLYHVIYYKNIKHLSCLLQHTNLKFIFLGGTFISSTG